MQKNTLVIVAVCVFVMGALIIGAYELGADNSYVGGFIDGNATGYSSGFNAGVGSVDKGYRAGVEDGNQIGYEAGYADGLKAVNGTGID